MISVIIPSYNAANFILQAVNSVINQTINNFECIVIDDGSTDETFEVLRPLINQNKIKYHKKLNQGVNKSRNYGIDISKGEFLLFLDADDILLPNALDTLLRNIENYDIVFGSWENFSNDNRSVKKTIEYDLNETSLYNYIKYRPTISTALIRRTHILKFDEDLKVWEVTDFFLKILLNNSKALFINKLVTSIRQHESKNRLSIKYDHFNLYNSLLFFLKKKKEIKENNMIGNNVEIIIDKLIIDLAYSLLRSDSKQRDFIKIIFNNINLSLVPNYPNFKWVSLYGFINFFHGFKGLEIFLKINLLLKR